MSTCIIAPAIQIALVETTGEVADFTGGCLLFEDPDGGGTAVATFQITRHAEFNEVELSGWILAAPIRTPIPLCTAEPGDTFTVSLPIGFTV